MDIVTPVLAFTGLLIGLSTLLIVAERFLVRYGVCKIDINAGERDIEVEGGQSLLAALNENRVFIPSACGGKGSCGYCKVTVLSGGGPILPTETPLLTRQEIRRGVRLACQVKVREGLRIRIPEEYLNVQLFTVAVDSTRYLTHDIKEIRLALKDPSEISHRPGQYVQVQAPSPEGPVFRAYSISSPAYEPNVVQLLVRLVPGGIGSTYLHNLHVGDTMTFTGPFGEFVLNEDPDVEVICVGGGCGMAPMRNIIYTLYQRWPERSCWLFFGCRATSDVFYLREFQQLAQKHPNFHVVYALSEEITPGEEWGGETGFIHLSVDKHLKAGVRRQAFLCGPPPMIEAVTQVLLEKGMRPAEIYYDKFRAGGTMAVITVAYVLKRAEEFELALASFYSNLAMQADQDGVRLLTGYLSRRRPRVPEKLALLSHDRLAAISPTPLAYEPYGADCHCLEGMRLPVAGNAAQVLDMAVNFNECLVRFYRQVIRQVDNLAVVELFESLICLEEQDEIELKKIKALDYF